MVSDGLHSVHGGEIFFPEKATLLGPVKVIPQEITSLLMRAVDVEGVSTGLERREPRA